MTHQDIERETAKFTGGSLSDREKHLKNIEEFRKKILLPQMKYLAKQIIKELDQKKQIDQ